MILRVAACLFMLLTSQATAQCRQALALGLDVSGSVDSREYRLQLDGLARALQHPRVTQALLSHPSAPVRLAIYEWSEAGHQRLLQGWTDIISADDLARITATLAATRRAPAPSGTAVGAAMLFGADLLAQQEACWKRTLDLSGDGKHNIGPHPREVKDGLADANLTINGLVIGADDPDIDDKRLLQVGELIAYYEAWVILGPDAFVESALGFEDFEATMARKLMRELQGLTLSSLRPGDQ